MQALLRLVAPQATVRRNGHVQDVDSATLVPGDIILLESGDLVPADGPLGRRGGAPPGRDGHNLDHFCLRLAPFDEAAIRRHLAAHGVEAGELKRRYGAEGTGPSLYLQDPEGNTIELKGPPNDN